MSINEHREKRTTKQSRKRRSLERSLDTIAAVATSPGRGGIGVIRISGSLVPHIAQSMLGALPSPRVAHLGTFKDMEGHVLDQGIVLYFPSPHSFTGEDVLELQGHGGPVVLDNLLSVILQLGGQIARPGEFSERAFLNGKMDLVQAEAVADLIDSASTAAAKAAMYSLQGHFSQAVYMLLEQLIALRLYVEATIDFPEEDVDALNNERIQIDLIALIQALTSIFETAKQGALLREGITVVIAGSPNAGKSSLINQLAGKSTAIVTDIPGTTRDVLREHVHIDGLPLHIVDTAGLHASHDLVEIEGMRRALHEMEQADQILWVIDQQQAVDQSLHTLWPSMAGPLPPPKKLTLLRNKIDLTQEAASTTVKDEYCSIKLSAKTGEGLDKLKEHLKQLMGYNVNLEGKFIARKRHLDALHRAKQYVQEGLEQFQLSHAIELLAENLRLAQQVLDEITGRFTSDDLLGRIFSSFCIGK
jgi:tRNA modification GTPase